MTTPEFHSTLQEAWDLGHDAVMLKNYIRPGGKQPENVVVARDLAQFRDPEKAAFDPSQRLSANLIAGLSGLGLPFAAGMFSNGDER